MDRIGRTVRLGIAGALMLGIVVSGAGPASACSVDLEFRLVLDELGTDPNGADAPWYLQYEEHRESWGDPEENERPTITGAYRIETLRAVEGIDDVWSQASIDAITTTWGEGDLPQLIKESGGHQIYETADGECGQGRGTDLGRFGYRLLTTHGEFRLKGVDADISAALTDVFGQPEEVGPTEAELDRREQQLLDRRSRFEPDATAEDGPVLETEPEPNTNIKPEPDADSDAEVTTATVEARQQRLQAQADDQPTESSAWFTAGLPAVAAVGATLGSWRVFRRRTDRGHQ